MFFPPPAATFKNYCSKVHIIHTCVSWIELPSPICTMGCWESIINILGKAFEPPYSRIDCSQGKVRILDTTRGVFRNHVGWERGRGAIPEFGIFIDDFPFYSYILPDISYPSNNGLPLPSHSEYASGYNMPGSLKILLIKMLDVQEVFSSCIEWVYYENWTRLLGHIAICAR